MSLSCTSMRYVAACANIRSIIGVPCVGSIVGTVPLLGKITYHYQYQVSRYSESILAQPPCHAPVRHLAPHFPALVPIWDPLLVLPNIVLISKKQSQVYLSLWLSMSWFCARPAEPTEMKLDPQIDWAYWDETWCEEILGTRWWSAAMAYVIPLSLIN